MTQEEYLADCGCTTLKQLANMNPNETAVEFIGCFLEWYSEKETK